jgi:kumamolisin
LIAWGQAESRYARADMEAINNGLAEAAKAGVTVVVAAGDGGATAGLTDGRRRVYFPASSPWVLSVGGTTLETDGEKILSETVWKEKEYRTSASGGGVSDVFERPDWQAGVSVPSPKKGFLGRGLPDVAATAAVASGAKILVGGKLYVLAGTTLSAAVWAGLIALINQGVGRNLGYFNPLLYEEIGPQGVLRPITKGDNKIGRMGYSAGPGWNAAAGWGSPDGAKLLEWLKARPEAISRYRDFAAKGGDSKKS